MEGSGQSRGVSRRITGIAADFVHRNHFPEAEDDGEIELSLGLSMNGRFGVDPARKKLRRTSSVSNLPYPASSVENEGTHQARGAAFERDAPLARTCSLPAEAEEWPRCLRKESQWVRCMEARKKRMEKLKNVRVVRSDKESSSEDGNGVHDDVSRTINGVRRLDSGTVRGLTPSSQGSIGSRKSGSFGVFDLNCQLTEEGAGQNPTKQQWGIEEPVRAAKNDAKQDDEMLKSSMLDMPYVCTRGCGPNHAKIEGFLYRYKKGEEVKIVCVCHGLFLSPAEFVKHGGGGDVTQPLKHIVVNPFPLF